MLSFIKSLPAIASILSTLFEMYSRWQANKIEKHYTKKRAAKSRLATQIKKATTDEERAELVKRLSNLTNS